MRMGGSDPRFSNFLLTKPMTDFRFNDYNLLFPYGYVWPPPAISARHRLTGKPAGIHHFSSTIGSIMGQRGGSRSKEELPLRRSEISDQTFQIRQWMEMGPPHIGIHLGEEIVSYSTLDPILYTPTAEKPWRGIWVGDYSGHGCEFLLINQPDGADEARTPLVRGEGGTETEEAFQERFLRERVHRGRLEAIKLTGDPNVPRGEYTFVSDDLGENGFVGVAQEPPFRGTRVVKSKGHIAATGFFDGKAFLPFYSLSGEWISRHGKSTLYIYTNIVGR